MLNDKAKKSVPNTNKEDEFELVVKIPEVGEVNIKVREEFSKKAYRSFQRLLPWLLSFALGGSSLAFMNGNQNRDQSPNHNHSSKLDQDI